MTIQDLGSIGELIAAVATLATLAYLAVQVRSARNSMDFATAQGLSEQFNHVNAQLAENPELADIYLRGLHYPDALSDEEWLRFSNLSMQYWNVHQIILELGAAGIVSKRWVEGSRLEIASRCRLPGLQRHLQENRHWFSKEMIQLVEEVETDPDLIWRKG